MKCITTSTRMITRRQWRQFINKPVIEYCLLAIGVALLVVSPLVAAIPGPGGIVVAGIALALVLKGSMWAKRDYVRFGRWQPRAAQWTDLALRRRSAKPGEELRKAVE